MVSHLISQKHCIVFPQTTIWSPNDYHMTPTPLPVHGLDKLYPLILLENSYWIHENRFLMGYRFQRDFNMVPSYTLKRGRRLRWHLSVGDLGSIPGLGRSPGEGKGYPLQYSGLENSMDHIVHGVAKSWTRLSDFHTYFFCEHLLAFQC